MFVFVCFVKLFLYVCIRDNFKKYKKINVTFVTSLILVRALMPKGDLD